MSQLHMLQSVLLSILLGIQVAECSQNDQMIDDSDGFCSLQSKHIREGTHTEWTDEVRLVEKEHHQFTGHEMKTMVHEKKQPTDPKASIEDTEHKTSFSAELHPVARTAEESALLQSLNTVVLNLDTRPDRMKEWQERFAFLLPDLQFRRISAVDGRVSTVGTDLVTESWDTTMNDLYVFQFAKIGLPIGYVGQTLLLSPGERGCAASHIQAWRSYLESGQQSPLLVTEDDAFPSLDFAQVLHRVLQKLPSDADILYLGYSQAAEWRRELSEDLVQSEYVWRTHGYMIWPHTARMLLSKLPVNQPVDDWLAAMAARRKLKAYCIRPEVIKQAKDWNVDSDIVHSDGLQ